MDRTRQPGPTRSRHAGLIAAGLIASLFAAGCARASRGAGELRARSLDADPAVILPVKYVSAVYAHGSSSETSFLLSDQPVSALLEGTADEAAIVHVALLWEPKPGKTPLGETALNASIRYVILSGGEAGVYGGAGFVMPSGRPGDKKVSLTVRNATLKLLDSTPGFADLLGTAQLEGKFTAQRDDQQAMQLHFAASQAVSDRVGRSMYVRLLDEPGRVSLISRD
jgi:hypothetical protein